MAKIRSITITTFYFFCPGCGHEHAVGEEWGFDGDYNRPSFNKHSIGIKQDNGDDLPPSYCHSWIKNGYIEYCSDSTHHLAGQIVPLSDVN